jgi:hypothetical protein
VYQGYPPLHVTAVTVTEFASRLGMVVNTQDGAAVAKAAAPSLGSVDRAD